MQSEIFPSPLTPISGLGFFLLLQKPSAFPTFGWDNLLTPTSLTTPESFHQSPERVNQARNTTAKPENQFHDEGAGGKCFGIPDLPAIPANKLPGQVWGVNFCFLGHRRILSRLGWVAGRKFSAKESEASPHFWRKQGHAWRNLGISVPYMES